MYKYENDILYIYRIQHKLSFQIFIKQVQEYVL